MPDYIYIYSLSGLSRWHEVVNTQVMTGNAREVAEFGSMITNTNVCRHDIMLIILLVKFDERL